MRRRRRRRKVISRWNFAVAIKPLLHSGLPPYRVIVSLRARRARLEVTPLGEVRVTIPQRFRPDRVPTFVAENRIWLTRTLDKIQQRQLAYPELFTLTPGHIALPAIERKWIVLYQRGSKPNSRSAAAQHRDDETLLVTTRTDEEIGKMLRTWLHRQAQTHLLPWLQRMGTRHGLSYRNAAIRGQQTRWGSCSARGTISLNRAMLFLPPTLVEYLLIHELCHTQHLNHSPRYWALVERCDPDFARKERELNDAQRWVPAWAHRSR